MGHLMLKSECSTYVLLLCLATLATIDRSSFGRAKRRPHEMILGFAPKHFGSGDLLDWIQTEGR